MKKILSLLIILLMIAATVVQSAAVTASLENPPQTESGGVFGDVNEDGAANNKDLTILFRYLSGYDLTVSAEFSDVNRDGETDNKDITALAKYLGGQSIEIADLPEQDPAAATNAYIDESYFTSDDQSVWHVKGWYGANYGTVEIGYGLNGGDPVFDGSVTAWNDPELDEHTYSTNSYRFIADIDMSDKPAGTYKLNIYARVDDRANSVIPVLKNSGGNFKVKITKTDGEPVADPVTVTNSLIDTDGNRFTDVTENTWYIKGWYGANYAPVELGYSINGGDPVFDGSVTFEKDADLNAHTGSLNSYRFYANIDMSSYPPGDYSAVIVGKMANSANSVVNLLVNAGGSYTVNITKLGAIAEAMPDTWVATDGLGRTLPTNSTTGNLNSNKFVGVFYWTWHSYHAANSEPVNIQQLCDENPGAATNRNHSVWKTIEMGQTVFWNEPIYGYYSTTDKWVLRKQAELLADAGVDVIIFDNTNGTFTWKDSYIALMDAFLQARADGVKTPQIAFMLPFSNTNAYIETQIRDIYETVYKTDKYKELWFYWNGKPLIMSQTTGLGTEETDTAIKKFFTFRPAYEKYNGSSLTRTSYWGWLSVYPQAVYTDTTGKKQTSVSVAQNWKKNQLTPMNGDNVFGRTYTSNGYDTRANAKLYGANFAQQWEYAIAQNVDFVFVTGWNEWVAQKQSSWKGVANAFPDEFNDTYSRDIEPSKGDLKDHYYYQLVSYIRQFKGTRAIPEATAAKTIDIYGDISQWDDVGPEFASYRGNTSNRNSAGYLGTRYRNYTGRNDILSAKVAHDGEYLYFMVRCGNDISPYTDAKWMRLFIDTTAANDGWEGFDYVVNRQSPNETEATLERISNGQYETVASVSYYVSGHYLTVKIPKAALGITGSAYTVNFKWCDNNIENGDIMEVYTDGDAAPGGRFMYSYIVK